jgi:hypothetical protein
MRPRKRKLPGQLMMKDLLPVEVSPARYREPRRKLQLSTTIALIVLLALAVIAVSIGIAQADTLTAMVDDEAGRLALFGLIAVVVCVGMLTATVMWLTAPRAAPRKVARI